MEFARGEEVNEVSQGGEGEGGTIRGWTSHCFLRLGCRPDGPGAESLGNDFTPCRMTYSIRVGGNLELGCMCGSMQFCRKEREGRGRKRGTALTSSLSKHPTCL